MKKRFLVFLLLCFAASMAFAAGGQARDGDSVSIGAVFPLSGAVSHFGNASNDGIILAVEEINAAGGLLGRRINLISEDDEGTAALSVSAFRKLTTQDRVSIVLGSSTSGATMAIGPLAQQQRVVLISPSATNINVTRAGDFIFRACFIDPFQGVVGADFAYDTLGARRAAVLYDAGADYNTGLAEAFMARFRERGGQVIANEAYQSGEVDFNAQVTRIRAANPDVVYLPNYYNDVALQAMQLRAQGVNTPLVGGDGWDGVADNAGREVLNGFWSSAFAADTTEPRGVAFVRAFQARFNRPATQFAALGYDTMMIVADAVRRAGTFDATAVRDAMASTNSTFVTGNIRFDANRNPIKGAAILEIVDRGGTLANVYRTTVNP